MVLYCSFKLRSNLFTLHFLILSPVVPITLILFFVYAISTVNLLQTVILTPVSNEAEIFIVYRNEFEADRGLPSSEVDR